MNIQTLGIDIAKNVFQLHGVNRSGYVVLKRRVMRDQLLAVLAQIDPCTVVVEACTGAFYWARKCEALGHQVKIISPQYVKPFVRRQKNDGCRGGCWSKGREGRGHRSRMVRTWHGDRRRQSEKSMEVI